MTEGSGTVGYLLLSAVGLDAKIDQMVYVEPEPSRCCQPLGWVQTLTVGFATVGLLLLSAMQLGAKINWCIWD
jgi:hypothetical protein